MTSHPKSYALSTGSHRQPGGQNIALIAASILAPPGTSSLRSIGRFTLIAQKPIDFASGASRPGSQTPSCYTTREAAT